jgi:hypothetical protein
MVIGGVVLFCGDDGLGANEILPNLNILFDAYSS